ncbi:SH3 domain-containing protein [Tropicibacter oceani]|uniref:SH3 domain-containing protein n=1 Tax=Tropicibacter oceani TaxID=3058420 RepID=A0ABY8QN18_9RHOB|nr:SH3 domain-containing protein [Tropicibacter oceani]WGW05187.1 SH3 domain-containing protein [Tropicibacter oceani]
MTRVILVTFGFLGWAWYEMSGGSAFEPGTNSLMVLAPVEETTIARPERVAIVSTKTETPPRPEVTRTTGMGTSLANVGNLTRVAAPWETGTAKADDIASLVNTVVAADEGSQVAAKPIMVPVVSVASSIDYRTVTGNRVNLRSGPSTGFDVVTKLVRGDEVEVLQEDGTGWVKLRALRGSDIGWMSEQFLVAGN